MSGDKLARAALTRAAGPLSGNDGQIDRREGGVVYFRARDGMMGGRRYRLYDVDRSAVTLRRVEVESPRATHRIFVQADQARWTYTFSKGERRELIASALERQLQQATYSNIDGHGMDPR